MGVQQSLSLAKQHPPRHPTPDILPLKSSTNCAATNIPSLVPSSKLWQVVQITKNIPSLQYRFSSVTLREEILPIIFNQSHEDIYKFNDPNAMNPQQVRANDSRSWIPRLGNLGQRVGTVVSSEGPRCRTPSTRQFVDSFVLHYRGEYRKRKRGRGREGGRQNAGEIGERRYIYIYIYRSTRADIRTSFSIRDRKWLRANWRALCAPPPPSGSSASGPAIRRIACHRPRARRILLGKIGPLC